MKKYVLGLYIIVMILCFEVMYLGERVSSLEGTVDVEYLEVTQEPEIMWEEVEMLLPDNGFKSYMDYRKVTDRTSSQWQIIHSGRLSVYPDGLIRDNCNRVAVAVGSHFGNVGDIITVDTETGSFEAVIVDIKATEDTYLDSIHITDGSMVEFVVDVSRLPEDVKRTGNVSKMYDVFNGKVVGVWRYLNKD